MRSRTSQKRTGGDPGTPAEAIVPRKLGKTPNRLALDFPGAVDGAHTLKFIASAVESAETGTWVDCRLAV